MSIASIAEWKSEQSWNKRSFKKKERISRGRSSKFDPDGKQAEGVREGGEEGEEGGVKYQSKQF